MKENKIFKSLNRPILPLGVTDSFLIFLGLIFISFFWFFFVVSLWLIPVAIILVGFLYFLAKNKIRKDPKYFLILYKSIKKDGLKSLLNYKK